MSNILSELGRVFTNMWRGPREIESGVMFYPMGNPNVWAKCDYAKAFMEVPEVNAVINLAASARSNGKLKVLNYKGEEVTNSPLARRIAKPNWFQDQKEFMRQTKLFHDIFGNEYVYNFFGVGIKPWDSAGLFTLPPSLMKVKYTGTGLYFQQSEVPQGAIKYTYRYKGVDYALDFENVIHMNDNRVTFSEDGDPSDFLTGDSKLMPLTPVINNIRMAYESRGVILKHRGALGILSNGGKDGTGAATFIDPKEKKALQDEYRGYGALQGQDSIIISNANLVWQQMGVNPDKLGLFQEIKEGFAKVLDAYNTPMELFVNQGSTYENQKQARKGFYESAVIPDANEWCSGLNAQMAEPGDRADKICIDYTHLALFQEDLKVRSDAFTQAANGLNRMLQDRAISIEDYRAEINKFGITTVVVDLPQDDGVNAKTLEAQATLRGSVGGIQAVLSIQASVAAGTTSYDAGVSMLMDFFGLTQERAEANLGQPKIQENGTTEETEGSPGPGPGASGEPAA